MEQTVPATPGSGGRTSDHRVVSQQSASRATAIVIDGSPASRAPSGCLGVNTELAFPSLVSPQAVRSSEARPRVAVRSLDMIAYSQMLGRRFLISFFDQRILERSRSPRRTPRRNQDIHQSQDQPPKKHWNGYQACGNWNSFQIISLSHCLILRQFCLKSLTLYL